jgi:hypothetical protein
MTGRIINYQAFEVQFQELIRKGYMTEEREITQQGELFYKTILSNPDKAKDVVKAIKEIAKSDFDTWWSIFPPHDGFNYQGKKFERSRGLRVDKDKCRELFLKMVNSQEYTASQIIQATMADVTTRKNASLRANENKLKYLQNSATYLRQKSFDGFVDEIVKEENVNTSNSVDI